MSIGVEQGPERTGSMRKPGAQDKDLEEAHKEDSRPSVQKRRSTIQKIKESLAQRRSERFYKFINHDLPWGIKVLGGMCVIFHWIYSITLEFLRQYCGEQNSDLMWFCDAVMRICVNTLFVYLVCAPNLFPEVWHAPGYFWLMLSFFGNNYIGGFKIVTIIVGIISLFLCLAIIGREIWLYVHAPKVYMAFIRHASLVDERGKILFYKHIKPALLDAGIQEVDDFKINVFLAEMGILTDAITVTEEISLFFEQFITLFEEYSAYIEQHGFNAGDSSGDLAKKYEDSYLPEEYPEPETNNNNKLENSQPKNGTNLEEIKIEEEGIGREQASIQIDDDEDNIDNKKRTSENL